MNSTSQHQSEIISAHNELGSMVLEFDNLQKLNKRMTEDAAKVEKEFYAICQKFQQEKIDWKSEQIRLNNVEHDNGRLAKELAHLTKQYQRLKSNHEKEVEKNKNLEHKIEGMEAIIEHMREIVFNDTSEDAGLRRAAINELQSTVNNNSRAMSDFTDDLNETTDKSTTHTVEQPSDVESDLNQAYGEYFTGSRTLTRQSRDYQRDFPIPSGNVSILSPTKPPRPTVPQFVQMARSPAHNSPLKSSLRGKGTPKSDKKCTFENESFMVESQDIYSTPTKKAASTGLKMLQASEFIPSELVLYVSALQNKLDHPDLYIKTPDTDDLGTIDTIKKCIRNDQYKGDNILEELDQQSTTVLCQLVKDFFIDNADKILVGGDDLCENMLQSVRSCNDQYLMTLFKSMPVEKQMQLAFLIVHLQSAVEAGRLPGELSCCFGSVVVSEGSRNKNDPKELIQKMIELPASFYQGVINQNDERSCSMLGPVDKGQSNEWKNLIKEKQKKLLQKLDGRLFKSPQL